MLRVKEIAKQKGLQLKDVAEKMNITRESLTRAISGNPQLSTLQNIAQALDVEVTELFPAPNPNNVMGYLEYNGEIIKINNNKELFELAEKIRATEALD